LLALKFNILFSAKHLPGKVNNYSDALSRLQVSKFQILMPQADLKIVNSNQTLLYSFLVDSANEESIN
jgi:hypothetical protein